MIRNKDRYQLSANSIQGRKQERLAAEKGKTFERG
jgi:hypothetical protein